MIIMRVDVKEAYFYIDAVRDMYARLRAEDPQGHQHDMCEKLVNATCDIRDAGQSWQRKCSEAVLGTGTVSPCHFYPQKWYVCGPVQGDGFIFIGHDRFLRTFAAHRAAKLKGKVATMGRNHRNELRVLNRSIKWAPVGILYEETTLMLT